MSIRIIREPAASCHRVFLFILFLSLGTELSAQEITGTELKQDSITTKQHSPGKAALMSALVPGLGQIYNKKYWKVPIVYAGFGVFTYFLITNTDNYLTFQSAYIEEVNGATAGNYADLVNRYTEDELLSAREYYRRNLEITVLLTTVWYAFTIIDASVDAHLMTFDVGQDLTLQISPTLIPSFQKFNPAAGVSLTLRFKNR